MLTILQSVKTARTTHVPLPGNRGATEICQTDVAWLRTECEGNVHWSLSVSEETTTLTHSI